jgi:acetyl-CoA carboxylase, biotin carboxylase subunit
MFRRVLVANRGEIAVRIMRTLREMGIESVAVYSDADRSAVHVRRADRAVHIGPAPVRESYLDMERVLDAASASGCDAVIPGYGFLSENAEFAQACKDRGLVFIGPSADAIRNMGSKIRARALMVEAGVPLAPAGDGATLQAALTSAARIGFPVLLKASAGGGGRGMRRVDDLESLPAAYAAAEREAARAFGDGTLYVEKALTRARHVEVQVLADQHGQCVDLFERDCSIQRRHQKVVEETPAPQLSAAVRERLIETALVAASKVAYTSAGTVEFLLDHDEQFYFLEMNTRLQVEHTITELVSGVDLVREMVGVAAGLPLGFERGQLRATGAAIECRICAEDPAQGFLPRTGEITRWQPAAGPGVRTDSGVEHGSIVGSNYDSLLAKLCVWAPTRTQAIARLQRALAEFRVDGLVTNLPFLRRLSTEPGFVGGSYDTGYLAQRPTLNQGAPERAELAALAAAGYLNRRADAEYAPMAQSAWVLASRNWP